MFKVTEFNQNAFVIVEGKPADSFFILRNGKVRLSNEMPIPGEEPSQMLGPGDFFGVVSCMSGHPHIETAQTLEPVSFIVVGKDQYGVLIQKNAPIAMKIIRYFSQRLRVIDKAITKLSFQTAEEENPQNMFKIGEFYFGKKDNKHAAYAYQRYLQYFPQGQFSAHAKARLQSMNAPMRIAGNNSANLGRSFNDGDMIMVENEPGMELYIIQSGKVKITKVVEGNEVLLAVLQPGDIFGEMAILENKPRSATAVAYGSVATLAINKANFETMVKQQPQLAVKLITILSERIWLASKQLANLLIKDPIGRIYDMLLTLALKQKIPIKPKNGHNFEITPQELIKMIGLPADKGEAYLYKLLEDKNVRLDQGKLITQDLEELQKQVQFHRKKAQMEAKRAAASQFG